MRRILLSIRLLALCFILVFSSLKTEGANYVWNGAGVAGGSGGTTFGTAGNWKVGGATPAVGPGASDNVSMTVVAGSTIVSITSNTTIASLSITLTGGNNNDYWTLYLNPGSLTITGTTTLTSTAAPNGTDALILGQVTGTTLTFGGAVTCTGDYISSNKISLVLPLYETDGGTGAVYIKSDFTINSATLVSPTAFPSIVYFDATGTQTLTGTAPIYYFTFPTVQIGKNNTPTVVSSGSNFPDAFLVDGNCTVSSGCTLILQQGGGVTSGDFDEYNTGTFTMNSGAIVEAQDNNSGTYGITGSNFPGGFSSYSLNVNSTSIYNPTVSGTSQTIYNTPTYGNLSITNASGSGNTTATAGGTITVKGNLLISPSSTYNGSNRTTNLAGNWTNSGTFTYGTSDVNFNGSASQALTGPTTFYDMDLTNTNTTSYIGEVFNDNMIVADQLTFNTTNKGLTNLDGYTLTIGTGGGNPASISYPNAATLAGWTYGGTLTRWFASGGGSAVSLSSGTTVAQAGFFPIGSAPGGGGGTAQGSFEPFWFGSSASGNGKLNTSGTLSLSQGSTANGSGAITSYSDASWANTVVGISSANWVVSNSGITLTTATAGQVEFGGNAFKTFLNADVNASYVASTVATYVVPLNIYGATDLEVGRSGLTMAQVASTWYIGTKSLSASPLPVSLTYFSSECNNYYALLKWATASESNNDHFTVERTQDGYTYETVAIVKGAGTTSETSNYSYVDYSPSVGTSYYRLSQTDIDGTTKNIGTAVFVPCENEENINAFASNGNNVNIQINAVDAGTYQINLINDMGQVVLGVSKSASIGLNQYKLQPQVANGIYFLQVIGNNKVYTHKLVLGRS